MLFIQHLYNLSDPELEDQVNERLSFQQEEKKLSKAQKKKNLKNAKIPAKVEHLFAFIKERLGYNCAVAKTLERNRFRFDMNCILYNLFRTDFLLSKARFMGEVYPVWVQNWIKNDKN